MPFSAVVAAKLSPTEAHNAVMTTQLQELANARGGGAMGASGGLMRAMNTAAHHPRSASIGNVAMGAAGRSTGIPVPRYGAVRAEAPTTGLPDTAKRPRLMTGGAEAGPSGSAPRPALGGVGAGAATGGGGGGGGAAADTGMPQRPAPARQPRQPRQRAQKGLQQQPKAARWGVY